ncbi:MAG: hypothetical protein FJX91_05240 [Bacteroidetes bacterium]|nr:hypothetical protein [Bacteroidota bacterium]
MRPIKLAVGSLALWLGCLYVPSVSAQDGKSNQSVGSYPPDEFSPKAKKYCSLLKKEHRAGIPETGQGDAEGVEAVEIERV